MVAEAVQLQKGVDQLLKSRRQLLTVYHVASEPIKRSLTDNTQTEDYSIPKKRLHLAEDYIKLSPAVTINPETDYFPDLNSLFRKIIRRTSILLMTPSNMTGRSKNKMMSLSIFCCSLSRPGKFLHW